MNLSHEPTFLQTNDSKECSYFQDIDLSPRLIWLILWATVCFSYGCGKKEPVPMFEQEDWGGTVDTKKSKEVQRKQDALIRLFTAIDDMGIESYQTDCPDLTFKESFDEFFGETNTIHHWSWDGPHDTEQFPVKLWLQMDNPDLPLVEKSRVYSVRRQGQRFIIQRAKTRNE